MALELDGTNQYLTAASGLGVINFPISISCFVYLDQLPVAAGTEMCAVTLNKENDANDWIVLRADDTNGDEDLHANYKGDGGAITVESDVEVTASTWEHWAGTFDTNSHYAYLNGTPGPQITTAVTMADWANIHIGAFNYNGFMDYIDGAIAEVGIWNAILTPAEMAILNKGYSPLFVRPANLVHYLPLIRNNNDIVGGMALTPINNPTVRAHPPIIYPSGLWVPVGEQAAPPEGNAGIMTTNTGFWGATF